MWGRSHPKYGPTGYRRQSIALVPEGSQNRTVKRDLIGEVRAGHCGYVNLLDSNLWEWGRGTVSTEDVLSTRNPAHVGDNKGTHDLLAKLAELGITPHANDKPNTKYKGKGGFGGFGKRRRR
ncbi:hypothetical protein PRIPAC_88538 [Pristionchus pacificus]|uniref:Uncharacterized protein n=1 Tax=Pristionchus pacificus TaxID=54126 RepID=A0A2A6CX48_PRIPA|nr:hypothetical protein PRIPAC_88538 [Pristionchus pacificus]|eukprot:PDM82670.1 hypothetical protein PRIPAC_37063 [Pristionchus pacificus]